MIDDRKRCREGAAAETVPAAVASLRREFVLFGSGTDLSRTRSADCGALLQYSPEGGQCSSSPEEDPPIRAAGRLSSEQVGRSDQAPTHDGPYDAIAEPAGELGAYIAGTKIPSNGWFRPCRMCRSWTGSTLVVEDFEVSICKKCQLSLVRKYGRGLKRSKSLHHSATNRAAPQRDGPSLESGSP